MDYFPGARRRNLLDKILSSHDELLDYSHEELLINNSTNKLKGLISGKPPTMDRKRLKFISVLLALLMLTSPLGSLAMPSAMSESQSSHCQDLETDSHSYHYEISDHASCTMENCTESCSASRHCSSQAPIILTLLDSQNHLRVQGVTIDQISDTHLSIHPPGLYRPPRI